MREEDNVISLDTVIGNLDNSKSYFLDVFNTRQLEAGILRLRQGEKDTQLPHSADEVYFVLEGNGFIEIEGKLKPIKNADFIFVPANARHKFLPGTEGLIVIYFLA
jgi:mannose-6-phosphate isomerase-like protein (cupin superfamily)